MGKKDFRDVTVEAPMSFTGSARRLWRPVRHAGNPIVKVIAGVLLALVICVVWLVVACWYLIFGLLLVPWRLVRRGQRGRKREAAMYRQLDDR